jgi:primosomal protein N' (replication factor Y)
MPTYLEVAVNIPRVSGVFHYHLPAELEGQVQVGHLVIVPFGQQTVQGVVLSFIDQPSVAETRPVSGLVDLEARLTKFQMELARHLADVCLAPLAACLGLMLPPGLDQHADVVYTPQGRRPDNLTRTQTRLLNLLYERAPLRGRQIDRAIPRTNWRASARALERRSLLTTEPILPLPSVRPKSVRTARLACPPPAAEAQLPNLGRAGTKALARRQAMLKFLIRETGAVNVSWIYAESGGSLADLRYLSERGLVILGESEVLRDPLDRVDYQPYEAPVLTSDQRDVWTAVEHRLEASKAGEISPPIMLHGVTGSGKTEIYLRAVERALALGKQAIVLVPEIALTPQTVRRFLGRFPGQVGLVHSGLSMGERYDTWRRARSGDFSVVIGPRSALFTPFEKLGLIVLDESHDDSYYQSEAAPYYHARAAAIAYGRLTGAVCLLGSATPDVVSYYHCQHGEWQYLHLPSRILAHRQVVEAQMTRLEGQKSRYQPLEAEANVMELPPVSVVDMRRELKEGNRSIFSRSLQNALETVLEQNQQAILFLNRRGSATYVFCRDCGHTMRCPNCEIPLTYHAAQGALRCHYCRYERRMPATCPACGSDRIRHYGTGTQRVEAEVKALFPQARTLRWDHETTRKKGAHEVILSNFAAQRADILVGTQMLAKGLDLPLVTLVGVVLADVGLSLPDYRTNERAFQVLTQVAGRAGRSPLGGQVVLQTFQPENYVIKAAAKHDYEKFFDQEIDYRRQLGYPPFTRLVRLEYRDMNNERAEQASVTLADQIRKWLQSEGRKATSLVGPAPCFFGRIGGIYRWQIVLRGPNPVSLLRGREFRGWRIEVNPPSLL